MRVVALVSGGKDSTYNMMQVTAEGHQVIALANLHPKDKGNAPQTSTSSNPST